MTATEQVHPASTPSVWQLLREDWRRHWHELTRPGFQALAAYRLSHWIVYSAGRGLGTVLRPVSRLFREIVLHRYDIDLHPSARLGRRVQFGHQGGIFLGPGVVVGDDCIIHQGVRIGMDTAGLPGAPHIGARVLFGARAVVQGSVQIGDDARIGPNTVITTDVPNSSVAIAPPTALSRQQGRSG